jgi:CXXC zinc finger domain
MSSLREIKQEWDRPVDMEWNKVLKRWQPMVFDDDDADDDFSSMDDDTAAAAATGGSYPLSVSSSSSVTMVGGDENNGDDNGSIALRRCMGRCGKCAGCRKEDCGECVKCKAMKKFGGTRSTGACIHRPCDKNKRPAAATVAAAAGGGGDDDDPNSAVVPVPTMIPQVGDRVYCLWPDTGVSRIMMMFWTVMPVVHPSRV